MLLWNDNHIDLTDLMIGEFHITATVNLRESPNSFKLTTVYGPSSRARKHEFLQEIISIKPTDGSQSLILGDFNLIYKASDKE